MGKISETWCISFIRQRTMNALFVFRMRKMNASFRRMNEQYCKDRHETIAEERKKIEETRDEVIQVKAENRSK